MKTLAQHLKTLNYGIFINDKNQYCKVTTWYDKSTFKIQVTFQKNNEPAYDFALNTTSIKKVEKLLNEKKFQNVNNN
jgi:hypothetical protein